MDSFKYIKAIFLLILAVSGNFVAETLSCSTQNILSNNMLAKQFVILLMIYFTLGFVGDNSVNPTINFVFTLLMYVIFICFTKMDIYFTLISIIILTLIYIIHSYSDYYKLLDTKDKNIKHKKTINRLENVIKLMSIILILIIVTGFVIYTNRQMKTHGANWSTRKFLFGVNVCDSLKQKE